MKKFLTSTGAKSTAIILAIIMLIATMPVTAVASQIELETIENTYESAIAISAGQKIEVGARATGPAQQAHTYYNCDMNYVLILDKPSTVNITLSTEDPPDGYRHNSLQFYLRNASGGSSTIAPQHNRDLSMIHVNTLYDILSVDGVYKLCPGTYYLNVRIFGVVNGFGWINITSVTTEQDDYGGEPNDTREQALANPSLAAGVEYKGNISYAVKFDGNIYRTDADDYYRFDVPSDEYSVKLNASRADNLRENPITARLLNSSGYPVGEEINLQSKQSGECEYRDLKKGTYFVHVKGVSLYTNYGTEYTFKLTQTGGANPLDSASVWAKEGIKAAVSKGYVPADIQGNYTSVITRQEFCRMAVKWVEYATGKSIDAVLSEKGLSRNQSAFTDTKDPDILAAFALGITSGTGNNQFTPNGQFSREQAATMIMNTCGAIGANVDNPPASGFADIGTASSWAVNGINFVRANGIMQGTGDNKFSPKASYTREQSIITFGNISPDALP